jgi:hypothetical protein
MAVVARVVLRGVSKDVYDKVRAEVGWLDTAPTGGIAHLSWWEGEDSHNMDAWESEEAFGQFGDQRLGPALAKLGVESAPEITFYPAHEVFLPKAVTITAT